MPRGCALSDDLRGIVLNMACYLGAKAISTFTGIGLRTIQRVLEDYRKNGTVARAALLGSMVRGKKRLLKTQDIQFLVGTVRHSPDLYLDEMRELLESRCGVHVSDSTIWKAMKRSGFTMKKLTRDALERSEHKRAHYRFQYGSLYTPEQTVFVDESSFDRWTAIRGKAWALSGQRAVRKCFFVRGRRYSLLPALSLNGTLWAKVVEGSFTASLFKEFIQELLDRMQPFPEANSVIIMDNAKIHKDPEIVQMIHDRGVCIMFLPPYSPDYNPIELAFSAIKAYVRRAGILIREDLDPTENDDYIYLHLLDAAFSITAFNAQGYFHHCGYL